MRRLLVLIATLAMAAGGSLLAASPASANEVWIQAYERPSEDAPCTAPADETPWQDTFKGQQEWTPSWAEWANGGKGGWVCQRTIEWAQDSGPRCVQASDTEWLDFLGGLGLPMGSADYVDDPTCTTATSTIAWNVVYAPDGQAQADALCLSIFGIPTATLNLGYAVWGCARFV